MLGKTCSNDPIVVVVVALEDATLRMMHDISQWLQPAA